MSLARSSLRGVTATPCRDLTQSGHRVPSTQVNKAAASSVADSDNDGMEWQVAQAELREMLWEWDPIGVANLGPDDEYDCLIAPLVGLLSADADQPALASFLRHQLHSHFGLDPAHDEIESVAGRLVSWREAVAQADPDFPTVCPACGVGPEQATDPEHMLRSVCYCGHPRYYDYRHRDGTCPCTADRACSIALPVSLEVWF